MKTAIVILLSFIIMGVSSCRKIDLYHGLSEEEANEMLVVLQQDGIATSKVKEIIQNETFWTVQVDPNRLSDARRLLVDHNLPSRKELGLSGVYKEKGLIPTPDEQKARFLLAVKGEIINSLRKIPEVVDADVILNIPTQEEFADPNAKEKRPTASIIIKARPSETAQDSLSEVKVQQFVANAVENLNPRDVSVIITYITPPKRGIMPGQSLILPPVAEGGKQVADEKPLTRIAGLEVVGDSQGKLRIYLAVFFGILAILAVALIITVIRTSRMRRELKQYKGGDSKPLIEGKVVDDRPRIEGR